MSLRICFYRYLLGACFLSLCLPAEEESHFALPERGRPRFRRYDQRPIPVGGGRQTVEIEEEDEDVLREASQGIRLNSETQYGFGAVVNLPVMDTGRLSEEEDEEEEEDRSFVNPMDFLTEEDLMVNDLEEEADPGASEEEEVMDWDSLHESLLEEGMTQEEDEAEAAEERVREEELLVTSPERSQPVENTGLRLESVLAAPEDVGGDVQGSGAVVDNPTGGMSGEQAASSGWSFEPEGDMGTPIAATRGEDADPSEPLAGSRKLFSEIRDRWEPRASQTGGDTPERSNLSRSIPSMRPVAPAPDPVRSSLPTVSRMPDPVSISPAGGGRETAPAPEPISRDRFQQDDGRVRSLIGVQP
jgi:hypothetical protein